MSAPAWMPLYVADFQADTIDLTTEQVGAYMILLMLSWQRGGSLPNDMKFLKIAMKRRAANMHGNKFNALIPPLLERYFHLNSRGEFEQKRLRKELEIALNFSRKQRENAEKRWVKPHNIKDISNATVEEVAHAFTLPNHTKKETGSLRSPAKKATRIPADFQPDLDEAERLGLSRRAAEQEAASFADYWRAKPTNATKLDWPATWRNWVRKAVKDSTKGETHGQFGRRPPPGAQESPTRIAGRIARGGG